jgi:DNA-binding MarR family transcriptional regulator
MFPIHEIPELDELRAKVAELNAPFKPEQMHAFLHLLKTSAIISRALEDFFARYDLNLARFSILALLFFRFPEGLTSSEMAAKRAVSKATLTSLMDIMAREKLIVRLPDPNDRRRRVIRLTTVGHAKMRELVPPYQQFVNQGIRGVRLEDIPSFLTVLRQLENFENAEAVVNFPDSDEAGQTQR